MLNPAINVLLGMVFFHEPLTLRAIIGCTIIMISCTYAAVFSSQVEFKRITKRQRGGDAVA
ncbi:MAG: hypothetical protein A4E72_01873 [Syntrophus sp. PtaU1.Bin208]|nr:MAG: hypothetical protein A4E72_01873 [Syntrophus sp. PtaU1.Bin208]